MVEGRGGRAESGGRRWEACRVGERRQGGRALLGRKRLGGGRRKRKASQGEEEGEEGEGRRHLGQGAGQHRSGRQEEEGGSPGHSSPSCPCPPPWPLCQSWPSSLPAPPAREISPHGSHLQPSGTSRTLVWPFLVLQSSGPPHHPIPGMLPCYWTSHFWH